VARALAAEPRLPLAVFVRGLVAGSRGQPEQALPDLYQAHALAPNDAGILGEVCRFSNTAGLRHQDVLARRLGEIDPLTPATPLVIGCDRWIRGQWDDEMVFHARRAARMATTPSILHVITAWQLADAGYRPEALDVLRHTAKALEGRVDGAWASFHERVLVGDAAGAVAVGAELDGLRGEWPAMQVAQGYAVIGRRDDAVRWLWSAVERGFINHAFLSEHSRHFAPLRNDPGFQALLGQVYPRWQKLIAWEAEHRGAGA
jgi:hypothetical protein